MECSILPSRSLIRLSGEEVIDFLQGLITHDARKLVAGQVLYAALLTPQGRFLHDFILFPWQGCIWLDTDAGRAPDLLARLKLYKLRSKVNIETSDFWAAAAWGENAHVASESIHIITDPRLPQLGYRIIGEKTAVEHYCAHMKSGDYDAHRLALGVPDGARDMVIDKSLLLECGFEALHGVDFNKGCYVGQEVTARSKFRGQVRKQFYVVNGKDILPQSGMEIRAGEKPIGAMRSSSGTRGLAIIHVDDYESAVANSATITAGDIVISLSQPIWMK